MSEQTEADRAIINNTDAAELVEQVKRDAEKSIETAQREKEEAIAFVYEMAGRIKGTNFFKSQAEFFTLLGLKKVKDLKEYREKFGMTWEQFCEKVGVNRRTIDRHLDDLEPFRVDFLDTLANFSGVPISKIKYLGMAANDKLVTLSENAIIYNGETIPLDAEHKDDIQALLENLEESHKKQVEETAVTLKTKDRLLKSKEDVINKMEKEIQRLEKTVVKTELSPEEQELMDLLKDAQLTILDRVFDCRARAGKKDAPESAQLSYYFLLIFLQKITADFRQDLHELYEGADPGPWEVIDWEMPPDHVLVDGLPTSRGMGKIYKEFMDKRNPSKG